MLGASEECPNCHESVIPEVPLGTNYPLTGYEITFRDFRRLLSDPAYRPSVFPLLEKWDDFDVPLTKDNLLILARDETDMTQPALHLRIQSNAAKQYELYQKAMSLWR